MAEMILRGYSQVEDVLSIEGRTIKSFFTTQLFFYPAILLSNWVQSILLGLSIYLIVLYHVMSAEWPQLMKIQRPMVPL